MKKYLDVEPILFEWEVPEDYNRFNEFEDLADAYRVVENDKADCGVVIYARYGKEWVCNPWSSRALVRHLIMKLKECSG